MSDSASILRVLEASEPKGITVVGNEVVIESSEDKESKMKGIHPSFRIRKRRSAMDRIKARNRYKRNRNKIKLWRKRYNQRRKMLNVSRKHLLRSKPSWFTKQKTKTNRTPHHKSFFHSLLNKSHQTKPVRHAPKNHAFKIKRHKTLQQVKPRRTKRFSG